MEASKTIPRGMGHSANLDLSSRRATIVLNLVAALSLVFWGWLFLRLAAWLRPGTAGGFDLLALRAGLGWPAVLGVIVAVLLLHEAVHGLFFWRFTGERPMFGLGLAHAYAAAPDWYLPRRLFLITGLAPLVVLSLVGVALLPALPDAWLAPLLLGLIINAAGATGDLYAVGRLLAFPPASLVRDTGALMQIYAPVADAAAALKPRWDSLMTRLGVSQNCAGIQWATLLTSYTDGRSYHDLAHILQLLEHLERYSAYARDRDTLELAIWYHDAVYEPGAIDNEAQSAAMARRSFVGLLRDDLLHRVAALIEATTHDHVPDDPDTRLLVDLDLAPLAASPHRFAEQSLSLRREYAAIPDDVYYSGQTALFRRFLERPRLYLTEALAPLEPLARRNLTASLTTRRPPP